LLLAWVAAARAEDGTLRLVPGSAIKAPGNQIKGAIQSETPSEVRIGGQTVPFDQIESIEYDGQPANLLLARNRESAGNLAEALELYTKAVGEAGSGKPLIAREAQFQRARVLALLGLGDPQRADEAIKLLEQFARAHPSGRQLGPALEILARLYVARENYDQADRVLAELSKIAWAAPQAEVTRARVLGLRGRQDEAIARLDAILAAAPEGSARHRTALLAKAEALGGLKRFDEAQALANTVIKAAGPEDVETQAAAHNALGDLLRQAGQPKDALLAYLHTDILYFKDREQHPRALARIVELCRQLKLDDQARETAARLRQEYPASPHAAALGPNP
jgi:tetratricopeptide (TPR) repeat protein